MHEVTWNLLRFMVECFAAAGLFSFGYGMFVRLSK